MSRPREYPVVFECAGDRLLGIVHPAAAGHAAIGVVVIVGGPQYRVGSHRQFVLMARDVARAGYPVLRFDYRGMGDSDGAPRSFEHVEADVRSAVDTLLKEVPALDRVILWGLCDAASASLMYCHKDSRVCGVVVANPWVHSQAGAAKSYLKHYYGQRLLQRSFWSKVFSGKLNLRESLSDFLQKIARASAGARSPGAPAGSFIERMRQGLQGFSGPTLVLMSEKDLTAQEFRGLCDSSGPWTRLMKRANVRIVDLEGADHTFSSREALGRATLECLEWLNGLPANRDAA